MAFPVLALVLRTQVVMVAASGVPVLDMNPTCGSAARRVLTGTDSAAGRETCLASERRAREELEKRWSSFNAADRTSCGRLVTMGGPPSYVELLTCLEMSADARRVRAQEAKNPNAKNPNAKNPNAKNQSATSTPAKKVRAKVRKKRVAKSRARYRRGWGYHI
jgi:hypothetical protein